MKFLRAFLLSLYYTFKEDYSYHASALSLNFLLVLSPMLVFFTAISVYLPFVDVSVVEEFLKKELPERTHVLVDELLKAKKYGTVASGVSVVLAYYFSVNFLKKLHRSFKWVVPDKTRSTKELLMWVALPLGLVIFSVVYPLFVSALLILKRLFPENIVKFSEVLSALSFSSLVILLYVFFLRIGKKRNLGLLFLFIFLGSFTLQKLFTYYTIYIFKGSVLYGSLSGIFLFFLWLNFNFTLILTGAKLLELYESL
ncbi:YhjD/YihY/BrkB family envelope integrity protein [Aquifex pyrophilus]